MNKISIIIPAYNCERYIIECLDSIKNQTYSNFEVFIIDDFSQDSTQLLLKNYVKIDERFSYIRNEKNYNVAACRNIGLSLATGDYIFFVDADDVLDIHCLEILYNELIKFGADVSICGFKMFNINEDIFQNSVNKAKETTILPNSELMKELALCSKIQNFAWGKLYKRQLFENVIFPNGRLFEDVYTIPNVLSTATKAVFVKDNLYFYRQNPKSISKTLTEAKVIDFFHEMEKKGIFYLKNYENCLPLMSQSFFELFYLLKEYHIKKSMIPNYSNTKNIYKKAVANSKSLKDKIKYLVAVM